LRERSPRITFLKREDDSADIAFPFFQPFASPFGLAAGVALGSGSGW
jgi:hypothetical protein